MDFFTFDSGVSKRCKHICYLVLNSATDHTKEHLPLFLSQLWSYLSDEWIFILSFSQFHDTLRTGYLLTCSSPLCVIIEMASTRLGKKKENKSVPLCESVKNWKNYNWFFFFFLKNACFIQKKIKSSQPCQGLM